MADEPGNDTAAGQAFQVGDRVRTLAHFPLENLDTEIAAEVVAPLNSLGYLTIHGAGDNWMRRPDQLTLISRVAFGIGDRVRYADMPDMKWREGVVEGIHGDEVILRRDRDGERRWIGLIRLELVSRATPAPARKWCLECDNTGYVTYADGSTDPCRECGGTGYVPEPATPAPAAPPALLQAIEGPLNMEQLGDSISLAWHAIQNAQSLTTDQTESEVLDALDKIGDSLHALFIAMRALLTLTASQKG